MSRLHRFRKEINCDLCQHKSHIWKLEIQTERQSLTKDEELLWATKNSIKPDY